MLNLLFGSLPVTFIARYKTGTRDEFRLMLGSVLTFPSGSSSRWALDLSIVCCERQQQINYTTPFLVTVAVFVSPVVYWIVGT